MTGKTEQLQVRVTPEQKKLLKGFARRAGVSVSAYVLSRTLPSARVRFLDLVRSLGDGREDRFVLAGLNDLLSSLGRSQFLDAVSSLPTSDLSPFLQNYLAAMIEQAAYQKQVALPAWLRQISPLEEPHFATPFLRLRLHLFRNAPVPFRRRNIFVDSGIGDRV